MDDLIEVRKEVTTIGSSKAPKETIYWPVSGQAKRVAGLLDRAWLYPCDLEGLGRMGFRIVLEGHIATVATDATVAVNAAP